MKNITTLIFILILYSFIQGNYFSDSLQQIFFSSSTPLNDSNFFSPSYTNKIKQDSIINKAKKNNILLQDSTKDTTTDYSPTKKTIKKEFYFTKTSRVNVRKKPSLTSYIIVKLKRATRVEKIKEDSTGKWFYIKVYKYEGWINKKLLTKDRKKALPYNLRNCDFTPQQKKDTIPGNPKIDVKGIYLTIYSASPAKIKRFIRLAKTTEINAFVIDVKDDIGRALFKLNSAELYAPEANNYRTVRNPKEWIKQLKQEGIYLIARIVCFKDPIYAKYNKDDILFYKSDSTIFKSRDGLVWASPYSRKFWEYIVGVAKEAAELGFNEIQFDYVRFPATNDISKLELHNNYNETMAEAIQKFLKYAYKELYSYPVYISADIFGLVTSNENDLNIGQNWEAISNVVDYICPMMYPSHYYNGSYNIPYPDLEPYKVIKYGLTDAIMRNQNIDTPAQIRPWFQAFTAIWLKKRLSYNKEVIHEQIKAANELGITSYQLWNAANRYYHAFFEIDQDTLSNVDSLSSLQNDSINGK